jgi:hypothetical protein
VQGCSPSVVLDAPGQPSNLTANRVWRVLQPQPRNNHTGRSVHNRRIAMSHVICFTCFAGHTHIFELGPQELSNPRNDRQISRRCPSLEDYLSSIRAAALVRHHYEPTSGLMSLASTSRSNFRRTRRRRKSAKLVDLETGQSTTHIINGPARRVPWK